MLPAGTHAAAVRCARADLAAVEVVLLARHGQTEWNRVGRRQGQLDSPLSAHGLVATGRAAAAVGCLEVDGVFSSPLGRARATAAIYAEALGLRVVIVDELRELDHGAMAGMTNVEIEARYPGQLEERARSPYGWRFPDGESYADVDLRASAALNTIAAIGARRPLVVSHEMIGRMLARNLCGLRVDDALGLSQPPHVLFQVDLADRVLNRLVLDEV